MFWRSSTGVFLLMAMTTCFLLIITGCVLLATVGGVFQKPPVIFSIHVGSGDVCSLCNNSLGCALTLHETFPDMKPEEVRQRCEITICNAWLPTSLCTQFWESGPGRAVVRAAWYNESSYCAYSPSCNSSTQPTAPPSPSISGACCTAGVCTNVTSRNCTGGTYQGDYTFCTSGFCGACCSSYNCNDKYDASQCSGYWQGSATQCGGLCGACTYNDSYCTYTIPSTCSYTYSGRGTVCGSTPGTTQPAAVTGACCYASSSAALCQVGSAATCTALSGTYQGDYTTCSAACGSCMTPSSNHPITDGDWTCTLRQSAYCAQPPSTFVSGQSCANPDVLGSCRAAGASCIDTYPWGCVDQINPAYGGPACSGTYQTGDCSNGFVNCYEVGHGGCFQTSISQCYAFGGVSQGYLASPVTCNVTVCPGATVTPAPSPPATTSTLPPPPTTSPAPTGTTLGTCCVKGVVTKNITSAACTSAGTSAGTTGYWFPVVPAGATTCSACCGNVPLTVFSCTAGLYYSGSTYTCSSAAGYIQPTNPAATYCKDSSGGYKCNRCWELPTTSIVATYVGSADPSFVWSPPANCVGGSLYNHSGSIVTASTTHVYTTGLEVVDATTSAPNSLGGGLASAAVWPRSYATGNSLIHYTSAVATPVTMTWQAAGSSVWALAVYISFQAANTDPKALGTFQLTAVDGFGNVAYNSLKTSPLFGTPLGWVVWSNMINIAQLQIVDINAPQAFYLGDFNARSG